MLNQVLEQMPQIISSLDAYMEQSLQRWSFLLYTLNLHGYLLNKEAIKKAFLSLISFLYLITMFTP